MRLLFCIIAAVSLVGCGQQYERKHQTDTVLIINGFCYRKVCLEGHMYYRYASGLTPKLTDEGLPCKCEE